MAKPNLELFDSEWAILKVVWEYEPCAAPTVQEELAQDKGWAYTTVKTLMDRMVKKGLLHVQKIRHLHLYRAAVSPAQAKKSEIMRTLKRAFNESLTPMMQFLIENEQISEAEYAELERMILNRKQKLINRNP